MIKNIDKLESRTKIYRKRRFQTFLQRELSIKHSRKLAKNITQYLLHKYMQGKNHTIPIKVKKTEVEDMFDNIAPKYDLFKSCFIDENRRTLEKYFSKMDE